MPTPVFCNAMILHVGVER